MHGKESRIFKICPNHDGNNQTVFSFCKLTSRVELPSQNVFFFCFIRFSFEQLKVNFPDFEEVVIERVCGTLR